MARQAILLTVAALVLAACGGSKHASGNGPLTVELHSVNGSGETGSATLTPTGPKTFSVSLTTRGAKDADQPSHIHNKTCAEYAKITDFNAQLATVVYPFPDVMHGKMTTTIAVPLKKVTTGGYSINVHHGGGSYPAVVCGDIPKR